MYPALEGTNLKNCPTYEFLRSSTDGALNVMCSTELANLGRKSGRDYLKVEMIDGVSVIIGRVLVTGNPTRYKR